MCHQLFFYGLWFYGLFAPKAPNAQGGSAPSVLGSLSIDVEGSVTDPKICMVKGMPEKNTGPEVKLSFSLAVKLSSSFSTYSVGDWQKEWYVQQGPKLQCSLVFWAPES